MPKARRGGVGDGKPASRKSGIDSNGDLCIGDDCIKVRAPKAGRDIEIDVTACSIDVQKHLRDRLKKGAATKYTVRAD